MKDSTFSLCRTPTDSWKTQHSVSILYRTPPDSWKTQHSVYILCKTPPDSWKNQLFISIQDPSGLMRDLTFSLYTLQDPSGLMKDSTFSLYRTPPDSLHCYKNWRKITSAISDGAGPNYQGDARQFRHSRWIYSFFSTIHIGLFLRSEKLRWASLFQRWKLPSISKFSDEITLPKDGNFRQFRSFPIRLLFLMM